MFLDLEVENKKSIQLNPQEILALYEEFIRYLIEKNEFSNMDLNSIYLELSSEERKNKNLKPRIEIRAVKKIAIQVALAFSNTFQRDEFFNLMKNKEPFSKFNLITAGTSTIEFSPKGIDKGTPLLFLRSHFTWLLSQMNYKCENLDLIDQNIDPTYIVSDADGTLWKKRMKDDTSFLQNFPTIKPLKKFLNLGGLLFINSGNDIFRIAKMVYRGFKNDKKALSRIGIFACGGTSLYLFAQNEIKEIEPYREMALDLPNNIILDSSCVYLGDDERKLGNDWPAFEKIHENRRICVSKIDTRELDLSLQINHLPALEKASTLFLQALNEILQCKKNGSLLSDQNIQIIVQKIRKQVKL